MKSLHEHVLTLRREVLTSSCGILPMNAFESNRTPLILVTTSPSKVKVITAKHDDGLHAQIDYVLIKIKIINDNRTNFKSQIRGSYSIVDIIDTISNPRNARLR